MKIKSDLINLNATYLDIRKLIYGLAVLVLAMVFVLGYQNFVRSPDLVKAAATPEACFATTGTTEKTITKYYWHENNDANQPACPRDVVIPSTIDGGAVVTIIGQADSFWDPSTATSFAYKSLAQVVIPDTITAIGNWAFTGNYLSTVTIPESVTSIGVDAFQENSLITVYIEGNPTYVSSNPFTLNGLDRSTVPAGLDGWTQSFDYYQEHASLVRVYSDNPDFISKGRHFLPSTSTGGRTYTHSGYIVNPVSLSTHYQDKDGTVIGNQMSGISSNPSVTSYKITDLIHFPNNPNSARWDIDKMNTLYYGGIQTTVTPPSIPDYLTPSPYTFTPSQPTDSHTFTYQQPLTSVPFLDSKKAESGELVEGVSPPANAHHPIITQSSLSLDPAGDCQTISQASLLSSASLPDQERDSVIPDDITVLGGLDFTLDHCQTSGSAGVSYTLGQHIDNPEINLKIYKHNPDATDPDDKLQDITHLVTFTAANNKTILSYELIDGGVLDQDGIADGKIVDPIYIGMLTSAISPVDDEPSAGSPADVEPDTGNLADTGSSLSIILLLMGSSIALGLTLFTVSVVSSRVRSSRRS